eukprot:COSAG05_NODE_32_length_28165_cov_450.666714_8_plen_148_part_00
MDFGLLGLACAVHLAAAESPDTSRLLGQGVWACGVSRWTPSLGGLGRGRQTVTAVKIDIFDILGRIFMLLGRKARRPSGVAERVAPFFRGQKRRLFGRSAGCWVEARRLCGRSDGCCLGEAAAVWEKRRLLFTKKIRKIKISKETHE